MRTRAVNIAKKHSVTCVCAHMFLQIAGCLEGFVTALLRTLVWFLTRVYTCVALEAIASRKSLATTAEVTLERTVTRV